MPVTVTLVISKAAFPVLVRVTACTALVVPSVWLGKVRLVVVRLTAGPPPVPVRLTVWGLPVALSLTFNMAVRVPGAAGVKVTVIMQLAPAATVLPQLLVWPKSPELVPDNVKPVMLKLAVPLLVRVTACPGLVVPVFWLTKVKVEVERLTVDEVPVPERLTVWGPLLALLVRINDAVRLPTAEGVKVTLIVQLAPADTEPPQLSLSLKSPAFAPVAGMGGV